MESGQPMWGTDESNDRLHDSREERREAVSVHSPARMEKASRRRRRARRRRGDHEAPTASRCRAADVPPEMSLVNLGHRPSLATTGLPSDYKSDRHGVVGRSSLQDHGQAKARVRRNRLQRVVKRYPGRPRAAVRI